MQGMPPRTREQLKAKATPLHTFSPHMRQDVRRRAEAAHAAEEAAAAAAARRTAAAAAWPAWLTDTRSSARA